MIERCKEFIDKQGLLKKKETVVLGVSGGPDSMFLLEMMCRLREAYGTRLVVAHFNHRLREEADAEERFVADQARERNCVIAAGGADVKARYDGDSLEQTARTLRYDFFSTVVREHRAKKVFLAHHKDDLAETVLLRIIRGSGMLGLAGMQPMRRFGKFRLVRPLLYLTKDEIVSWLDAHRIPFMIDHSNFEDAFLRNRIRKQLIPVLTELNPAICNNLYTLSATVARDYDFIAGCVREAYAAGMISHTSKRLRLKSSLVSELHTALRAHLFRYCIEQVKGDTRRIEARHLDEIVECVEKRPSGSTVDLPGCRFIAQADELVFESL